MAKGYIIYHVSVADPELYREYIAADAPVFARHGGRFIVRGGEHEAVEGTRRDRHVVIEFPSYAAAKAYYHSPEYQAATRIRERAAVSDVVIVEGVD